MPCAQCQCDLETGSPAHAIVAALHVDDFDAAIALGLLDDSSVCAGCSDACRAVVKTARRERETALAARERHRARNARLQRRQDDRALRRKPVASTTRTLTPALPPAAAAALARAKAKAAARKPQ